MGESVPVDCLEVGDVVAVTLHDAQRFAGTFEGIEKLLGRWWLMLYNGGGILDLPTRRIARIERVNIDPAVFDPRPHFP